MKFVLQKLMEGWKKFVEFMFLIFDISIYRLFYEDMSISIVKLNKYQICLSSESWLVKKMQFLGNSEFKDSF